MDQVKYERVATDPDVSVVIPTIPSNDHGTVTNRLAEQSFSGDWEVLVVNDPDIDRCEARNIGLREAKADIVAFTDDDTEPPTEWLASIYESFRSNPSLVCLEGRVVGGIRYSGEGRYVGCNMAVNREAALSVNGWDSRFAGWREDTEFGWRMEVQGDGACEYHDEVVMRHPNHPRTTYKRQKERLLRTKYPDRYGERINTNTTECLWRYGQAIGLVPYLNRLRNAIPL